MTITRGSVSSGGAQTTPAFSAIQQNKRDVWDKIRLNLAQNCKLFALIGDPNISESEISIGKGIIKKAVVSQKRFECFNYTDYAKYVTAVSSSGVTDVVVDSTAELKSGDTLYYYDSSSGKTVTARIDSVTNTTTLVVTNFGDIAWAPVAGTVIGIAATAYGENSSNPSIISKDFDNIYNTVQISREPVGISNSMLKSEFHATKDYFKLLKMINLYRFVEKIERNFLFSNRAAGAVNTTSGGASLTTAFSTSRGWFNWAANSYDMKGSMTNFKLRTELPRVLKTVSDADPMLCMGGFDVIGRIEEMLYDKVMYTVDVGSSGKKTTLQEMGVATKVYRTQTFAMELLNMAAFNEGDLAKVMFIGNPNNVDFVHLPDRDIAPNVGIQENDRDGRIDEVICEAGCRVTDGGQSAAVITNCW